jgi:transaldolase
MTSAIARLNDFGQSPWYDNLARPLLTGGGLQKLVEEDGIRGVTSNPTILDKAIGAGEGYDEQLAKCAKEGLSIEDTYWEVVIDDIRSATDILRPVFDAQDGGDGFVSLEVAPTLAHDTASTIALAQSLHDRVDRPNLMIKIPATLEGIPAIEESIANGVKVNVTLIFSLDRHDKVIEAYLTGLERLVATGGDPSTIASVASFFVSRVDTEVDQPPERARLGDRLVIGARDARVDLDRDAPVDPVAGVVGGPQDVARVADVLGRDRPQRLADVDAADGEIGKLRVVKIAARDRLLEDRRVGGDAHQAAIADQVGKVARLQPPAAEVIEPDGDAGLRELA